MSLGPYHPAANTEVNVDIARDGTLLFVNGRNRLAIAKLFDVDTIPVGVYVRHAEWMRRRAREPIEPDLRSHPDVRTNSDARFTAEGWPL